MSSDRSPSLRFIFSIFLVIVQLKVSTNSDAIPLQNIFNLDSFSIEDDDRDDSFDNLPQLLFQAASEESPEPQPKIFTSTRDKLKIMAAEVVEKMNDFYDLLQEADLIEIEETAEHQRAEDFDNLATREIKPAGSKESSDDGEFTTAREDFSDPVEEPRLLDKPQPATNAGQKVRQMVNDAAASVAEMFEKLKKRGNEEMGKENVGTRAKKMLKNAGKKMKNFYDEKLVKRFKELCTWSVQLNVEVKPLSIARAQPQVVPQAASEP